MRLLPLIGVAVTALACGGGDRSTSVEVTATLYSGSESCRDCHERFYQYWAPSHHGLAMQPFTAELARERLVAQADPLAVNAVTYQAVLDDDGGRVVERGELRGNSVRVRKMFRMTGCEDRKEKGERNGDTHQET